MIGPAGTFAGPRATDHKPWRVHTYLKTGELYERQRLSTEDEARDLAAIMGTVKGQRGWTHEVYGPDGYVATYKGGRELKRKAVKP